MSATEKADAVLIVFKRLLKWAAFALLAFALVLGAFAGYNKYEQYQRERPRFLKEYAGVTIGESAQQVRYAMGMPVAYLDTVPEEVNGPWSQFPLVSQTDAPEAAKRFPLSSTWLFAGRSESRITVDFDKPGGVVASVSCFSKSVYLCPEVFGLQDGSSEQEVLDKLGKPDSEILNGPTKTMQYSKYNVTLYLEKKAVYQVLVAPSRK